ncbi:hypothetical protein GCM10009624_19420 [Gordonia sinesedis]
MVPRDGARIYRLTGAAAILAAALMIAACGESSEPNQSNDGGSDAAVAAASESTIAAGTGVPDGTSGALPSSSPAPAPNEPSSCGPLPGKPRLEVKAQIVDCAAALDLLERYLADPRTQRGDHGAQMGEWGCEILGAAEGEEKGYTLVCVRNDGARVTA